MFLKNIQLINDHDGGELAGQSICITEMFLWELGKKFKTDDCEAIIFICDDKYNSFNLLSMKQDSHDVLFYKHTYEVETPFNINEFNSKSHHEKKVLMANTLKSGMLFLCEKKNWDKSRIEDVFLTMKEKDFFHQFKAWRPKLNPNRNKKAYPLVQLDLYSFKLYLVVEDTKKNILCKDMVVETDTFIEELGYYMHELKWLSNKEVALFTRAHQSTYFSLELCE
ncbi:hypothetical protein PJ311_01050 [Bacillus sp. CLL-7-23]|uniref:Uncharacterized protein n=1 Tax=Bacillus changyiensis TaxID=3004103 RepID=A0ABT4X1B4_9BACI|nr:hypothetical protein [Bacillus changyiensis]MDA7025192.1 hypothetical protein [Bacillus changyiensis]